MERFVKGSYILPLRVFTADKHIIFRKIGQIIPERMNKVIDAIIYMLKQ